MTHTLVTFPSGSLTERATVRSVTVENGCRWVVTDRTPFHPVDPGWPDQGPDHGTLDRDGRPCAVVDCVVGASDGTTLFVGADVPVRRGEPGWSFVVVHIMDAGAPDLAPGDEVTLTVAAEHRSALSAGHTGCHLAALALNAALAGRWRKTPRLDGLGRPLPARVTIYPPFYTDHGLNLRLAEGVFINQNCTFLDYAGIRLAERVMIAPKVTFITVGHPVDTDDRRMFLTGGPIDVAENVWIGAGATILPGVSIGRDAVIAAGSVVAEDVPASSLVTGPKATVRRQW
jgi:acetyltransferase-like isoleucine patch superfamily enzyme